MKKVFLLIFSATLGLFLSTGCDQIKAFISSEKPQKEETGVMVNAPELQILGVSVEEQMILSDFLEIRGLMRQSQDYVVIINTQLVRKGEVLSLDVKEKSFRVEVQSIDEMRVILKASEEEKQVVRDQGAR